MNRKSVKILLRGYVYLNDMEFDLLKKRAAQNSIKVSHQVRQDIQAGNANKMPVNESELRLYIDRLEKRLRIISNMSAKGLTGK